MIVGIDLGTTNSLIGSYSDDGVRLYPNALGELLTPSVVSLDETGTVVVGQAARDRLVTHPERSVGAFKRWMGTPREVKLGDRTFRAEELSALVLRSLLADAEAALGTRITEAVISVPAYFSDAQRKATRAAGELAGLRVDRLINEPTAAALAYGLQDRQGGGRFLVLDLGGGTFDVSILELFDGVVEVHASAGDNFLGGEDFLDLLEAKLASDAGIDLANLTRAERAQLRQRLERAKRELSVNSPGRVDMDLGGARIDWSITEESFARIVEPLVQRMRQPLERAMRDARLDSSQLDDVVLVGGASRMPLVARLVARMFGQLPLRHVNPDQAIAAGAATAAAMKARDARLEEIILTDVCPYTLGTSVSRRDSNDELVGGFFHPIIQRNSTVPISREDSFVPATESQDHILIDVYQGENPLVEKNIRLGQLSIPIRRGEPGNAVTVRFTYDINGVLQVEARSRLSGQSYELVLEQNPGLLQPDEIRARLAALAQIKIHPRDQQENIAVLARAERLYEEHLDRRTQVLDWIVHFRSLLDKQDEHLLRPFRDNLIKALDELEGAR